MLNTEEPFLFDYLSLEILCVKIEATLLPEKMFTEKEKRTLLIVELIRLSQRSES